MPGLVPGIHVFAASAEDVDGRDKPGHDEGMSNDATRSRHSGLMLASRMTLPHLSVWSAM
jgi:hypothetical protein